MSLSAASFGDTYIQGSSKGLKVSTLSLPACFFFAACSSFCVVYNTLRLYNRSILTKKDASRRVNPLGSLWFTHPTLASRGRASIPLTQREPQAAMHGPIGPAMEAGCTLTPEEIGSLVIEELCSGAAV